VAQLAGRTNQFNLTGVRYDAETTLARSADPGYLVASFRVADRFGDEGIVGAAWIEREPDVWRVTNLVLSCRVLGRGVELAIASWIVGQARAAGAGQVEGRFVPSNRNGVAADFWRQAGFTAEADPGIFTRAVTDAACPAPEWITLVNSEVPR
jgi:FkbH-like protein